MILYVTKKTKERLKLPFYSESDNTLEELPPIVLPEDDDIFKWGVKIFYFEKKKCLQIMNFASKFCVFLVDVKVTDVSNIGDLIYYSTLKLYKHDKAATTLLHRYFIETPAIIFDAIKDRSVIASMNANESSYLLDGNILSNYIKDHVLHISDFCREYNFTHHMKKTINGKKTSIIPGEEFKRLLEVRYGVKKTVL